QTAGAGPPPGQPPGRYGDPLPGRATGRGCPRYGAPDALLEAVRAASLASPAGCPVRGEAGTVPGLSPGPVHPRPTRGRLRHRCESRLIDIVARLRGHAALSRGGGTCRSQRVTSCRSRAVTVI